MRAQKYFKEAGEHNNQTTMQAVAADDPMLFNFFFFYCLKVLFVVCLSCNWMVWACSSTFFEVNVIRGGSKLQLTELPFESRVI